MCGASLCVGALQGSEGEGTQKAHPRHSFCLLCNARLDKVKHHRASGTGRICNPRCKPVKRQADSTGLLSAPPAPPQRAHKRKAVSDPGQRYPPGVKA